MGGRKRRMIGFSPCGLHPFGRPDTFGNLAGVAKPAQAVVNLECLKT